MSAAEGEAPTAAAPTPSHRGRHPAGPRRALARLAEHVSHAEPAHAEALLVRGAVAGLLGAVAAVVPAAFLERSLAGPTALGLTAALLFLLLPRQAPSLLVLLWGATALVALLSPTPARFVPFYFTAALGLLLAFEHQGGFQRGVALLGPSLGGLWGLQVVAWLSARHLGPAAHLGAVATVALGLFVAAGAAAAGLEWSADGVTPRLRADPKLQRSWERLRVALARLPEPGVRRQLQALARASAERWLAARAETAAVAASLDDELEARSKDALLQLEVRLEATTDAGVADSLRHLARVHRDTLEQFDGLRRRRERLEAAAASEAAWLETAAFTVELAPRTEWARGEMASRLEALCATRA